MTTLYPHEVVVRWFKAAPFLFCLSVTLIAVVTWSAMIVLTVVMDDTPSAIPTLVYNQPVPVQWSCASPVPSLILIVFGLSVIYYGIRICSPGWGLGK